MKRFIKAFLLFVLCAVIFYFSSREGNYSQNTSDSLLAVFYPLYKLFGSLDVNDFVLKYGGFIRKCAHFAEFFLLGLLAYLNAEEFLKDRALPVSLVFSLLYAVSDEVHQLFVPGRSGQLLDVVLDFSAAFLAIILMHYLKRRCQKE